MGFEKTMNVGVNYTPKEAELMKRLWFLVEQTGREEKYRNEFTIVEWGRISEMLKRPSLLIEKREAATSLSRASSRAASS